ncbi:MAG TPA: glucoamylase family protein [Steroidobacteraceae bacterium]|nr:glucoamylase family protein [Steroidobacteraceae bacterium]
MSRGRGAAPGRRRLLKGLLALSGCGMYGLESPVRATARTALALNEGPTERAPVVLGGFFDDLERRTFNFFWETANPANGLIPDRFPAGPEGPNSSIASVGFGLTAYAIGVERGYITREAARARVLATLRFFEGATHEHGFFYHFIDLKTGARFRRCELSTVDTTWLLAGMLFSQSYFDADEPAERELRELADDIYGRVEWTWAQHRAPAVTMGWTPESGFLRDDWLGYDEAMMLYVLALGSPTHPVEPDAWRAWTSTYDKHWGTIYGQTHLSFPPLFGHQYSHVWIDFRGIRDEWMRHRDLDYFENSRRATYAQRSYAIDNPRHWRAYGANVWGLTACEGPGAKLGRALGRPERFYSYMARGVGVHQVIDDGTIAPTAALGSLPFAPEIVIPAAREMHERFGTSIYSTYGFFDSFNPTLTEAAQPSPAGDAGWVDQAYLGIDQGPILAMLENYRSDLVWRVMRGNRYVQRGLKRAGFEGGWLDKSGKEEK